MCGTTAVSGIHTASKRQSPFNDTYTIGILRHWDLRDFRLHDFGVGWWQHVPYKRNRRRCCSVAKKLKLGEVSNASEVTEKVQGFAERDKT